MYEDLHYNGHIIHNGLYFKPRHILRRRPQKDGEQPSFVLVDFQKSSSLKAVPEEDLPDALGLEDWALMDNLGYNFVRGSDFRLYDHQRDLICGYQAPWPLLRGAV
ncbi:hypothetical protein I317_03165 [Kwoniella heveanensis CBS 569]|nr:hypothetical protein I317_03165 [Kwoniella heveanensis CBS 569]